MLRNCFYRFACSASVVACFTILTGCRIGAPVHVWSAPTLQSTVDQTVMVPRIVGPKELAEPIHEQLLQAAPSGQGCETKLVAADALNQGTEAISDGGVSLVSYDQDDESDLALATTARQKNIDYILRGEIMPDRRPRAIAEAGNRLTVSWRLMPVHPEQQADTAGARMGKPVVVELDSVLKRYPDLALATDKEAMMQTALIRDTLPLITPTVQRDRVQLEIAYLLPGSRGIRRGNRLAVAGLWADAESAWQDVYRKYPFSSVAVHNLAIASVAKQEFSEARTLARKAVRMKPTKLHQQTMVWVERTQREFHDAFDLPDPPEGWFVTRRPESRVGK